MTKRKKNQGQERYETIHGFEVLFYQDDEGYWGYVVSLDDIEVIEKEPDDDPEFDSFQDAVTDANYRIQRLPELWREPDFWPGGGFPAVWWGVSDDPREADAFTEVDTSGCVSEYTFVGGYEGFGDDQWLKITTCLDERYGHPRLDVGVGVEEIQNRGGEEEILTHDEVMREFGDLVSSRPDLHPNPSTKKLKSKLLR